MIDITQTLVYFAERLERDMVNYKDVGGLFDPSALTAEVIGIQVNLRLSNGAEMGMQSDLRKNEGLFTHVSRGRHAHGRYMNNPEDF